MYLDEFVGMKLPERDWIKVTEARTFIETGNWAYQKANAGVDEKNEQAMFIFPAIVNLSFALELYLKSYFKGHKGGHHLTELFKDLPEEIQKIVIAALVEHGVVSSKEDLLSRLDIIKNIFIESRYFYEQGNMEINVEFLNIFLKAISTLDVLWDGNKEE